MKKMLLLGLVLVSMAACHGEKGKKIKDVANMKLGDISKLAQSLTLDEAVKLGVAVSRCKANADFAVCNETIEAVIK